MIEVVIPYNEVFNGTSKVLPDPRENAEECVRYETLIGIVLIRRLRAAGIPVKGVIFPLAVERGLLIAWQNPKTKALYYCWHEDVSVMHGGKLPPMKRLQSMIETPPQDEEL